MDVLVIGWSDIVRRRVLPALDTIDAVAAIHVATTSADAGLASTTAKAGRVFTDGWQSALDECPDTLVYVSGINTDHYARVLAALESGHDVVVDKPAVLTREHRAACLAAAATNGRVLAEATVWPLHAQVTELIRRVHDRGLHTTRIASIFTIPALPASNFRTQVASGGGAVADMGAYAMSPGRVFGTGELVGLDAVLTQADARGLDVGFSLEGTYSDGLVLTGRFRLDGEYANRLAVSGPGWSATLQPAFSSKPDAELTVALAIEDEDHSFAVPGCDPFAVFLASVIDDVTAGVSAVHTERTAESTEDLLALAEAVGLEWPGRLH
jgi:predicted dehydrogenase